jgi:hypothetical protein
LSVGGVVSWFGYGIGGFVRWRRLWCRGGDMVVLVTWWRLW